LFQATNGNEEQYDILAGLNYSTFTNERGGFPAAETRRVPGVISIDANLDEAKGGFNQSKDELQTARTDLKATTRKNKETAIRTSREIQRLQSEQAKNAKETGVLTGKIEVLNKEIKKNEQEHVGDGRRQ
jgi:hypothetical protein